MNSPTDLQRFLVEKYRNSYLNVRVSPVAQSVTKHVEDMFVPVHMTMIHNNEILNTSNPEQFNELLKEVFLDNIETVNTLCLNGQEGMGKTSLCKKIISVWCNTIIAKEKHKKEIKKGTGIHLNDHIYDIKKQWRAVSKTLTSIMQKFLYVFFVSLKYVENERNIEEMIISQLLESKNLTEFEEVIANKTDKCLYIVDGLDEWNASKDDQGFAGVPERKHKCQTMFTTRPWKMTEMECNSACFDKEIIITGIDKDLADWMAENVIKNTESSEYSKTRPVCNSFYWSCPMFWRSAVSVWINEGKKLIPNSMTDLYTAMIDWNLEQLPKMPKTTVDEGWKPFPKILLSRQSFKRHAMFVRKLAHFSFDFLGRRLDFTDKDLTEKYNMDAVEIQVCHALGIQKTTSEQYRSTVGIHRSFQEFFAAVHLAIYPDKMKELFEKHTPSLELNLDPIVYVLIFLSGFNPHNVKHIFEDVKGLRTNRKRKVTNSNYLLQQINTQNLLSRCMKEARSIHELDESIPAKKICLSIFNDSDILQYFDVESVKVLAIHTDQHDNLTKLAECKTLRTLLIDRERPDRWKATHGERNNLINMLLQEQRCLGRIQITDVTLETTSIMNLLCGLETLESAIFRNVSCRNSDGYSHRKNVMKYLKLLYVHSSKGIVDTICEAESLRCLIISDLPKGEEDMYISMKTPMQMEFITASSSSDPTFALDDDEGFYDYEEHKTEQSKEKDEEVSEMENTNIHCETSYRLEKFETPKTFWPVYDFSYLYVNDLCTDFVLLLKELHLRTTKRRLLWNKKLSDKVLIVAIGGAIELTDEIIPSSTAHSKTTDISSVKLDSESETQPIVIVAFHKDLNSMTRLCDSLKTSNCEEPLCVILSESENHFIYNLPTSKTQVLNDKDKLCLYVNDLLERFAFENVHHISMILHKIELAAENASTERLSVDTKTSTRWKQDYISYLKQLDLVLDGQIEGELVDSQLKRIESQKDRIETIKSKISIMYKQSQIPSFERPCHVKRFIRKPLNEDMVSTVLQVNNIVGVGESFGHVNVYIDKECCKEEQEKAKTCIREILDSKVKFFMTAKEIQPFNCVGARVGEKFPGTLGCFALMQNSQKESLCALISAHVLKINENNENKILIGKNKSGQNMYGHYTNQSNIDSSFDKAVLTIDDTDRCCCDRKLKDEASNAMEKCDVLDSSKFQSIPYLVHIWGAVSTPGLGQICDIAYDGIDRPNLIRICNRSGGCRFAAPGDSGAIVCLKTREGGFYLIAMLVGNDQIKEDNKLVETENYIALKLPAGISYLEKLHGSQISICRD